MTVPSPLRGESEQERRELLNRFFNGAGIDWPVRDQATSSWERLCVAHGLPTVLPFLFTASRDKDSWLNVMLLADNSSDFRELCDNYRAFLGPSFTQSTRVLRKLPERMRFLEGMCSRSGELFLLHTVIRRGNEEEARNALRRWAQVRERSLGYRPSLYRSADPGARTRTQLRRFQEALLAQDRAAALAQLQGIEEAGLLEAVNRLFLRIRFHAAFNEWDSVLDNPRLADLLALRRPSPITADLLTALYQRHIAPCEEEPNAAIAAFRADVYPFYRPLLRARGDLFSSAVVRMFLLRAVAIPDDTDPALGDELLALGSLSEADREFMEAVIEAAAGGASMSVPEAPGIPSVPVARPVASAPKRSALPPSTAFTAALEAFDEGRDDTVRRLLRDAPSTREKAGLMLRVARRDGSLVARATALEAFRQLPPAEQRALVPNRAVVKAAWERLMAVGPRPQQFASEKIAEQEEETPPAAPVAAEAMQAVPVEPPQQADPEPDTRVQHSTELPVLLPGDWEEWLDAVAGGRLSADAAYTAAEAGLAEWPLTSHTARPRATLLAKKLDRARDVGGEAFVDAFPLVAAAVLQEPGYPREAFQSAYESLRLTVAFDVTDGRGINSSVLSLYIDLMIGQLATGLTQNSYKDVLAEVGLFWERGGPGNASHLLSLLDVLRDWGCPDEGARQGIARVALRRFAAWLSEGRTSEEARLLAARLAREYGVEGVALSPAADSEDAATDGRAATAQQTPWEALSGRSVALYTLMEPVGVRLRQQLEALCPGVRVELNAEKDGSPWLRDLAQRADLFVMVTGCAKHAATEFIERHRPGGRPLLRPTGRGSSSILGAVESFLRPAGVAGLSAASSQSRGVTTSGPAPTRPRVRDGNQHRGRRGR